MPERSRMGGEFGFLKTISSVGARAAVAAIAALFGTAAVLAASDSVLPPDGQLTVNGRGPFTGHVGSFCTASGCADSPWVTPASGPSVAGSATMVFRVADGSQITQWTVYYADAAIPVDPETMLLASAENVSIKSFSFTGPPSGDWGVMINVVSDEFDAQYLYRVHAGMPDTDLLAPSAIPAGGSSSGWMVVLVLAGLLGALLGWSLTARREPPQPVT